MIGPRDFAPYRSEIGDCHCQLCRNCSYAASGHGNAVQAATELLDALRAGHHHHVTFAEHVSKAKVEHAARVAAACIAGKSELHMLGLHLGYQGGNVERLYYREPYNADFMVGIGLGVTPGRHAAADARLQESRRRFMQRRAVEVERLILADQRNGCTHFRMSGELCTAHAEQYPPPG